MNAASVEIENIRKYHLRRDYQRHRNITHLKISGKIFLHTVPIRAEEHIHRSWKTPPSVSTVVVRVFDTQRNDSKYGSILPNTNINKNNDKQKSGECSACDLRQGHRWFIRSVFSFFGAEVNKILGFFSKETKQNIEPRAGKTNAVSPNAWVKRTVSRRTFVYTACFNQATYRSNAKAAGRSKFRFLSFRSEASKTSWLETASQDCEGNNASPTAAFKGQSRFQNKKLACLDGPR